MVFSHLNYKRAPRKFQKSIIFVLFLQSLHGQCHQSSQKTLTHLLSASSKKFKLKGSHCGPNWCRWPAYLKAALSIAISNSKSTHFIVGPSVISHLHCHFSLFGHSFSISLSFLASHKMCIYQGIFSVVALAAKDTFWILSGYIWPMIIAVPIWRAHFVSVTICNICRRLRFSSSEFLSLPHSFTCFVLAVIVYCHLLALSSGALVEWVEWVEWVFQVNLLKMWLSLSSLCKASLSGDMTMARNESCQ